MLRFLAVPAAVLLFASCQEKGPLIDFLPPAKDTSYTAAVEAPQQRVVLIEEFTGVTCPQCPAGHRALKSILAANAGRVAIVGIQPIGNAQSRPFNKDGIVTRRDNRTQAGTDIGSAIYGGVAALPQAGIDRMADGGAVSALFLRTDWSTRVDERKAMGTKANVSISTEFSSSTRQAAVTVKVAYTDAVSMQQRLTVAITENKVIDVQELGEAPGHEDDYDHEHVLRDILTTATGSSILNGMTTIPAGQVYERTFIYTVPPDFNPDNMNVVAYVSNNEPTNQDVVQAAEKTLK